MDRLPILAIHGLHEIRDRARLVAMEYQMEMVGHEAVGEDIDGVRIRVLGDQAKKEAVIVGSEEGLLAVVAALCDV